MNRSTFDPIRSHDAFVAAVLGRPDPTSAAKFLAEILCRPDSAGAAAFAAAILGDHSPGDGVELAAGTLREWNFDPDQPRDERGRWTAGDSGTAPDGESGSEADTSEADNVKTLKDCAARWRKDGYDVAAMLLEYFLAHKNGRQSDVCDASKLPFKSRESMERSSRVVKPVLLGLTNEARAKAAKVGAGTSTFDVAKDLGHVRSDPLDGEIFWAFGGFDLSVKGRLTVDGSNHRWQFNGSARIDDTYTFPATTIRMLAPAYAAANTLEKQGYTAFKTALEWPVYAEGSSSSVPGSPRVKYSPK